MLGIVVHSVGIVGMTTTALDNTTTISLSNIPGYMIYGME